ncbi:hypothetical protein NUACC26_071530 [Scytonema sp. NUACC26]
MSFVEQEYIYSTHRAVNVIAKMPSLTVESILKNYKELQDPRLLKEVGDLNKLVPTPTNRVLPVLPFDRLAEN